ELITETREWVKGIVAPLAKKRLTDQIRQYLVRAALLPAIEYRLVGIALDDNDYDRIAAPVMRFLKHAHNTPATIPSAYFHHRRGAWIPRLQTRLEGRNIEAMLLSDHGSSKPQ
ncbi:hypothetical protein EV182_007595, partial [Spiromyces aspiralis]